MSEQTPYETEARAINREPRAQARPGAMRADAPTAGPRLTRRRRTTDPFFIDPNVIPKGWSYEWKRESVHGQPDSEHMINIRENHWKPVPAEHHPELAAAGESVIRRGGTVLMMRPKYLTDEAQMEDIKLAMEPVQHMEQVMFGTAPDQMPRDHPSVRRIAAVRQQYAPGDPGGAAEPEGGLSAEP